MHLCMCLWYWLNLHSSTSMQGSCELFVACVRQREDVHALVYRCVYLVCTCVHDIG
ncbi:hypothetical protein CIPAW_12G065200 [Carya illinoinensis]|uniref:Uncharacterized protein n=1 Tax=Carya illinoinensis TaxID=32201 RepID=A0A8T1NXI2_CARIL|nr:hypothetical protein CIPAW_12G065200 [Carya illinoinensis]